METVLVPLVSETVTLAQSVGVVAVAYALIKGIYVTGSDVGRKIFK